MGPKCKIYNFIYCSVCKFSRKQSISLRNCNKHDILLHYLQNRFDYRLSQIVAIK